MTKLNLTERYGQTKGLREYQGELEFEIRDRHGRVIEQIREPNIIKIFAKEILSHRLPYSKVWDPNASGGAGAWVTHNIDIDEFAAKYIVFGASFDESGNPLDTADTRYYTEDSVVGGFVPISLGTGAEYDGGLINAVPISEPTRPLKRIERVFFEPSYQPAGTPLLAADVRAVNNVVVLETTLLKSEYNGLGITASDFFTLTEVALVGADEVDAVGACECAPRDIFLTGSTDGDSFLASASGTETISIDPSEAEVDTIKEGDQIKIVAQGSTAEADLILNQLNPYYLVVSKALGGRDLTLDRTPVDADNVALSGDIGILRDGFRIFSHRILKTPVKKSEDFEIVVRWRIICN
jgi:hypothetical protein